MSQITSQEAPQEAAEEEEKEKERILLHPLSHRSTKLTNERKRNFYFFSLSSVTESCSLLHDIK